MLLFVPVFAPMLAHLLSDWTYRGNPGRERYGLNAILMAVACWSVVFFFPSRSRLQEAMKLWFPVGAVHYIREHPVEGRMLNLDDWGGYLIKELGRKVFIDGRVDLYEPRGVLLDYLHITYPQHRTLFLLRKYHIRSCLIPPDTPLALLLANLPNWKVLYRANTSVLFLHEESASEAGPERVKRAHGLGYDAHPPKLMPYPEAAEGGRAAGRP